ncbi:MAG: hypothetical protein ACRD96_23885 [Bryobacteraceae bacterium]
MAVFSGQRLVGFETTYTVARGLQVWQADEVAQAGGRFAIE